MRSIRENKTIWNSIGIDVAIAKKQLQSDLNEQPVERKDSSWTCNVLHRSCQSMELRSRSYFRPRPQSSIDPIMHSGCFKEMGPFVLVGAVILEGPAPPYLTVSPSDHLCELKPRPLTTSFSRLFPKCIHSSDFCGHWDRAREPNWTPYPQARCSDFHVVSSASAPCLRNKIDIPASKYNRSCIHCQGASRGKFEGMMKVGENHTAFLLIRATCRSTLRVPSLLMMNHLTQKPKMVPQVKESTSRIRTSDCRTTLL